MWSGSGTFLAYIFYPSTIHLKKTANLFVTLRSSRLSDNDERKADKRTLPITQTDTSIVFESDTPER